MIFTVVYGPNHDVMMDFDNMKEATWEIERHIQMNRGNPDPGFLNPVLDVSDDTKRTTLTLRYNESTRKFETDHKSVF